MAMWVCCVFTATLHLHRPFLLLLLLLLFLLLLLLLLVFLLLLLLLLVFLLHFLLTWWEEAIHKLLCDRESAVHTISQPSSSSGVAQSGLTGLQLLAKSLLAITHDLSTRKRLSTAVYIAHHCITDRHDKCMDNAIKKIYLQ